MNHIFLEEKAIEAMEATQAIPDREATVNESLKLIAEGWGSIFIVILIIIGTTLLLNRVFSKKR